MLLRTALLCLFSATLVVSQFSPPEIIDGYDPLLASLEEMNTGMDDTNSTNNAREIRGLLGVRHNECPSGYAECANKPGRLAPRLAFTFFPRRIRHARFGRGHLFSVSRVVCV